MDFPKYSDDASLAREIFLRDDVSAIFYFEDEDHEVVYERLIGRLIPNIKEFAVICVGGKAKIIEEWKCIGGDDSAYIFILDKDYDDILGRLHNGRNLFYLKKYCFENYLLDVGGFLEIAIELSSGRLMRRDAVRAIEDYCHFFDRLVQSYRLVTRFFLVVRKFCVLNLQTTKMSIDELLQDSSAEWPYPTEDWSRQYKDRLQKSCHGDNEWLADDSALQVQLDQAFLPISGQVIAEDDDDHMCGKHLIRCIRRYMESRLKVNFEEVDNIELYLRLVNMMNMQPLQYLADSIVANNPLIVRDES